MTYNLNGKNIRIPDKEIDKNAAILGITRDEAIQMYLEDEGYLTNEYVEELTAKAKAAKISHEAKSEKPRKNAGKPRERKPDEEKEYLIKLLEDALNNEGIAATAINKSKLIQFELNGNHYKVDLIRQRPPKEDK
jgi:predicted nuclease of restriction endonuclease-like RecB superfamily